MERSRFLTLTWTIRSHQHDRRNTVTVFIVVLMFLVSLSTACGDDATGPNRSQPTSITVRPDTHDFDALKASTQLEATVLDQMGQKMTGSHDRMVEYRAIGRKCKRRRTGSSGRQWQDHSRRFSEWSARYGFGDGRSSSG